MNHACKHEIFQFLKHKHCVLLDSTASVSFYNRDQLSSSSQCVGSVMGLGGIPRKLFELRLDAAAAATGQYNAKAAAWIFSSEFFL